MVCMGGECMIYYKKINHDGTINMIGTQDTLPSDAVEISCVEYTELCKYIQEHTVHEQVEDEMIE